MSSYNIRSPLGCRVTTDGTTGHLTLAMIPQGLLRSDSAGVIQPTSGRFGLRAPPTFAAVGQVGAHGGPRTAGVLAHDGVVDAFVFAVYTAQVLAPLARSEEHT